MLRINSVALLLSMQFLAGCGGVPPQDHEDTKARDEALTYISGSNSCDYDNEIIVCPLPDLDGATCYCVRWHTWSGTTVADMGYQIRSWDNGLNSRALLLCNSASTEDCAVGGSAVVETACPGGSNMYTFGSQYVRALPGGC